ncbi:MAG: PP2C family protein-serine/threonine phosphatase, partial [Gemmatimonadales bacterium]
MSRDSENVSPRKPRDDEIDVYGISDRGKVRPDNQDQFLLASVHKHMQLLQTSLSAQQRLPLGDERVAFIAMVADGVGGGTGGEEASATALEVATRYLTSSVDCYYRSDAREDQFFQVLQDAAHRAHEGVLSRAEARTDRHRSMATTLTVWMGVWPWHYLLQVGDSRYYIYRDGKLAQITRDQTMAQDLVDQGVLSKTSAHRSQFANVLSSAIGGPNTAPVVTRIPANWNNVHLLCTDGLTKHVSDDQIAARLGRMTSAKQVCEQLLQDALDGGGTDNVT